MAFKTFVLHEDLQVTIYKRKGATSLRLSVTSTGTIRVTIPTWTPYAAGLKFAKSRQGWITAQKKPATVMQNGQAIGKAHHLELLPSPIAKKVSSRVIPGKVVVRYPSYIAPDSPAVQKVITSASIRALRSQAEKLLPQRIDALAKKYGFAYLDVSIKQLKSRWGSCDQKKHIVLNLYLMQLPWELIDYVLLHELTHTQHLNHGPDFWETMKRIVPGLPARRKAMRSYQPMLHSSRVS
ncbi:MAG: SprT family zinc-dependent metalloprotease [Patescibacteria group bacterium]|nr:SprT family zinc-dependent metalloprotease [Patescibacteria group bacterium]